MEMDRRRMVLNPGHAVCVNPALARSDAGWIGGFPDEGIRYWEHTAAAARLAGEDAAALLVLSGGMTRVKAGRLSEAESLKNLLDFEAYFGFPDLRERVVIEPYATDSLTNMVFSLCRFRVVAGVFPTALTVVGWEFKRDRYELHRQAIGWGREFHYVGVNNPAEGGPLDLATAGERLKVAAVREDPYLQGPEWRAQREQRNPFGQQSPYRDLVPELVPYFDHLEGGRGMFTGTLPWA
jgi:hypothetical protein